MRSQYTHAQLTHLASMQSEAKMFGFIDCGIREVREMQSRQSPLRTGIMAA